MSDFWEDNDALPFGVQGDTSVVEESGGNYTKFEDGNYEVKGILEYIKQDENQNGVFVPKHDKMKAMFKLMLADGSEGPPMSATTSELVGIVRAFGGDISKLVVGETSKFLFDVKAESNRVGRTRKCNVYKGWAQWIEGSTPPADYYQWEYRGARSNDGSKPVTFKEKSMPKRDGTGTYPSNFAWMKFAIVGDMYGMITPWTGYEIDIKVYNPFDGGTMSANGNLVPSMSIGAKGGIPIAVKRFLDFIRAFCPPSFANYQWESDVERSEYGVNEFDNPLVVIDSVAYKAHRRAVNKLALSEGGMPKMDLQDFSPVKTVTSIDRDAEAQAAQTQPKELLTLVEVIEKKAGVSVFEPTAKDATEINLIMTNAGKMWAKETIVPAWDALKLPVEDGMRYIGKLSGKQMTELVHFLQTGELPVEEEGF